MPRTVVISGALDEESRTDASSSFRQPRIEVPDLESTFEAKRAIIEADELRSLLVPPDDEVKVQDIERLSRTIDSSVPANCYEQTQDLFARKCIEFYSGGWNIVKRKEQPEPPSLKTPLPLVYEADLKHAHTSSAEAVVHELATFSEEEVLRSHLLCSRAESRHTIDSPMKQGKKEPMVNLKAKAKKRCVVFRFKTSRGPPILELIKEDSKRSNKEELDLSVSNSIEVDSTSTDTFVINFDKDAYIFQCEDTATREKWVSTIVEKVGMWGRVAPHANGANGSNGTSAPAAKQHFSLKQKSRASASDAFTGLAQSLSPAERRNERRQLARPDLLAVYQVEDEAPLDRSSTPPPFMSEYLGHRFVVTCQDLTMAMHLVQDGRPVNPEPMYCSLALYDLSKKRVISERFHFDLNQPRHGYCQVDTSGAHLETRSRRAVFSVANPHPEVYLVLFVEKTLQKDHNAVIESYIKGADNAKAAERQSRAVADALSKGESHRMPFAWATRPVFSADGSLDTRSKFSPLFKQELEKLRVEDMFRALQDYHRITYKTSTQGKVRFTTIPGEFAASVERYAANYPTVTPALLPVAPYPDKELAPRREVMPFFPEALQHAHLTYYDFLYIYPRTVNFTGKRVSKSSNARNVLCRVMLLDSDKFPLEADPSGAPHVFGRSNTQRYVTCAETTVSYHARQPYFNEEVKIALPPNVTRRHHLLFTFFHVSVKEKKKSKGRVCLGHALLPLAAALTHASARFNLCVAAAGGAHEGGDLPANYLENVKLVHKSKDLEEKECEQDALQGLTWLDDGKPLFTVDTRSHSTVRHHDDHLRKFFHACTRHDRTTRSDKELCNTIKGLRAMNDSTLYGYLPVIFNQLLDLLPSSPSDHDDVTLNVITYLLYAVDRMHGSPDGASSASGSGRRKRSRLVHQYVEHVFRTSYDSTSLRSVHDGIAQQLLPVLKDKETRHKVVLYAWFFLRLISKSMAQVLTFTGATRKPRKDRFSEGLSEALMRLFHAFTGAVREVSKTDLSLATSLNTSLAEFVLDLFPISDRGFCFKLIESYLHGLDRSTSVQTSLSPFLTTCRFDFIRIICECPQFVSLNLPLMPETIDECVSACDHSFKRRHYPAWVLLSNVQSLLAAEDRSLQERAVATLRNVLIRQDHQLSFHNRAARERVAMLFFPIVHMVIAHHRLLTTTNAEPMPGHLSHQSTRDLLACFLFVLKNYDPQLIIYYHRSAFSQAFFDVLRQAIDTFHYKGRKEIVADLMDAPLTTQHAIKLIESDYTEPQAIRRKGSSASGLRDFRTRTRSTVDRQHALSVSTPGGVSALATPRRKNDRSGTVSTPRLEEQPSTTRFRLSTMASSPALNSAFAPETLEKTVRLEGHFALESSIVVLEMVELILKDFPDTIEERDGMNKVAQDSLGILLELVRKDPCDNVVPHVFAAIKAFAETYPNVLFNPQVDYNQELCHTALRACSSALDRLRKYSTVLLYFLLKQNIGRMTQDILVSVSKIAGTLSERADKHLQRAIGDVAGLAQEHAASSQPGFSAEVEGLMRRVRTVLVNTSKFQQYMHDPEALIDLQCDVADSYSTSPDLRVTWLEKMASNHAANKCWVEAGMCVVHGAAITAQVLAVKDAASPYRLKDFSTVSPNISMEKLDALAVEQAKSLSSPLFTVRGLVHMVRVAISCLKKAEYYELVGKLYNLITPRFEEQCRYTLLSQAYSDLHQCYDKILHANKNGLRHFATYYRVKFFGAAFESLDGTEFIYKEPNITPLATVSLRLKELYVKHLAGRAALEMITDSKDVDKESLDPNKAYLQITHVEPYFDEEELKEREFHFQRNFRLQRFIYETPFTASGKARSEAVTEQYKRKTILTLANNAYFPSLRKRLEVKQPHDVVELTPIQVAIDEMSKKVQTVNEVVSAPVPNLVMLQLQLQGILTSQVNAGPMEYAVEFLGNNNKGAAAKNKTVKRDMKKLSQLFGRLLESARAAVHLHSRLITQEHVELQMHFESGLERMTKTLEGLIPSLHHKRQRSVFQASGGAAAAAAARKSDEPGIHFLNDLLS